jgi:hypothetical protein
MNLVILAAIYDFLITQNPAYGVAQIGEGSSLLD